MRPVLFEIEIFGWQVAPPTYGLILAAAFVAALWVALRQARRAGVDKNTMTDLWIACLLSGVVGAKLLLYVLDWHYYLSNPWAILTTLRSAGVFYGGLAAAIVVCLVIVRRRGLDAWLIADIMAPAIAIGQAIGRWGCFAAGCCWGKECDLPWAVTFTDPRAERYTGVPLGTPLHPTQLYLSGADLVLFLILLGASARKKFRGQVFILYLILYSVLRGSLEFFRGDPRGEMLGLSTSQAISVVAFAAGSVLYVMRSRATGD